MNNTWFTSDTHFWHYNIIQICKRPFGNTGYLNREEACKQMNAALIERWNSKISKDDDVYHLGDFAFCGVDKCDEIFSQLNGKKYLIRGNHDGSAVLKQTWEWVKDYYVLHVHSQYQDDDGEIKQYHQPIVLCHFPILSWDGMHYGSWHLHGHCHGSLPDFGGFRLDMGVDCNNWYPVSFDELKNKMALRTVSDVDHHRAK